MLYRILPFGLLAVAVIGLLHLILPEIDMMIQRQMGVYTNAERLGDVAAAPVSHDKSFTGAGWKPVHLELPRLNVDLQVMPGYYDQQTREWRLDDTHAFHAPNTETPLIYGHTIPEVFASLEGVAPDEMLTITERNGAQALFIYKEDQVVTPDDVSILRESAPDSVFLLTCTGSNFEERRVLRFEHVGEIL